MTDPLLKIVERVEGAESRIERLVVHSSGGGTGPVWMVKIAPADRDTLCRAVRLLENIDMSELEMYLGCSADLGEPCDSDCAWRELQAMMEGEDD